MNTIFDKRKKRPCYILLTLPGPPSKIEELIQYLKHNGYLLYTVRSWLVKTKNQQQKKKGEHKETNKKLKKNKIDKNKNNDDDPIDDCYFYNYDEEQNELMPCEENGMEGANVQGKHFVNKRYSIGFIQTKCLQISRPNFIHAQRWRTYAHIND